MQISRGHQNQRQTVLLNPDTLYIPSALISSFTDTPCNSGGISPAIVSSSLFLSPKLSFLSGGLGASPASSSFALRCPITRGEAGRPGRGEPRPCGEFSRLDPRLRDEEGRVFSRSECSSFFGLLPKCGTPVFGKVGSLLAPISVKKIYNFVFDMQCRFNKQFARLFNTNICNIS